ncbi:MAG: hypothetical protein EAY65_00270 [Alphaproteobacteria bacterium]|nr:MAG: hypothetical protein EAY65_00270 [Alphaproteobacteria bacterium]
MGINQLKAWAQVGGALIQVFGLDLDGVAEFFGLDDWEDKIAQLEESGLIDEVVAETMQQWGESETRDKR